MIKVAHVISSLKKGGAEEVLCSLVEQLDPAQFVSCVLYFHDGPHVDRLRGHGIKLYHIRGFVGMYDPLFWWRLMRTLYRIKPDCIHALLWSAQCASRVIGRLLGIPVITVYHNQATLESGMRLFLDRVTLPLATSVVAVSNTVAHSIASAHAYLQTKDFDKIDTLSSPVIPEKSRIHTSPTCSSKFLERSRRLRMAGPASHVITIANGIDIQRIEHYFSSHASVSKADLNIPAGAQVIGTVGRLHKVKNHTLLLQAYALVHQQHPNSYLILVGDGPERDGLEQCVQRLNLRSQVIFVTQKQAYPYYSLFDCFVLASEQEGMSLALLEAHYFKCASVVAHATLDHDVITHGYNGLLVPPNNAYELSQKISSVLSDTALQQKLGMHAHRQVVEKYTVKQMVNQYEQLFKKFS